MAHTGPQPNVTPLIDVLLVLIVIFMATLPLSQASLDSELPPAVRSTLPAGDSAILLEYTADGRIAINSEVIERAQLGPRLSGIYRDRADRTMFVAGASSLRYKHIVDVIDEAKGAGVTRVGIVTDGMKREGEVP